MSYHLQQIEFCLLSYSIYTFNWFSYVISLASSSRKMLGNSNGNGHTCLVPDFSGSVSIVFLLIMMLNYDLESYICCIMEVYLFSYFDTVVKNATS